MFMTPAFLDSDQQLLNPVLRRLGPAYRRNDVELAIAGLRRRVVELRAQLQLSQTAQAEADAIVTSARLQAAEIMADANIAADRLLVETQKKCQHAARHGIQAAFEMAGALGYRDTKATRVEMDAEEEAFERFFSEFIEEDPAREWMIAS